MAEFGGLIVVTTSEVRMVMNDIDFNRKPRFQPRKSRITRKVQSLGDVVARHVLEQPFTPVQTFIFCVFREFSG